MLENHVTCAGRLDGHPSIHCLSGRRRDDRSQFVPGRLGARQLGSGRVRHSARPLYVFTRLTCPRPKSHASSCAITGPAMARQLLQPATACFGGTGQLPGSRAFPSRLRLRRTIAPNGRCRGDGQEHAKV